MKDGYYLSIYSHIDELAHLYSISMRHDQHMVLWEKQGSDIELVHYWEFERYSGLKKHSLSFFDKKHATSVINKHLNEYGLTINDMVEIWGTPNLSSENKGFIDEETSVFSLHSLFHLYSSMGIDSSEFYGNNIIALALDAGPDSIIDPLAYKKDYYTAAISKGGSVKYRSIPSPGPLWAFMSLRYDLREGSLMALGSASKSEYYIDVDEILEESYTIKNRWSGGKAFEWFEQLADEIDYLDESYSGEKFNFYDLRFNEYENKISMLVKVIQKLSMRVVDNVINEILWEYKLDPKETVLSMSGGYSLNCPTNSFLMEKYKFKKFLTSPCVSDSGIGLGMGLHMFYSRVPKVNFKLDNAYYGHHESNGITEIESSKFNFYINDISEFDESIFFNDITTDPIVWFNGRAEIGPRALGNRSILADPRSVTSKDKLNKIKQRQWWRPVAPIILEHEVGNWFMSNIPSEFMLMTHKVKEDKLGCVPAILHLDNTARVQTVGDLNRDIYKLVNIFNDRTGIPILCNTSLNDKGEPIINTFDEMLNFALRKKIGVVYYNKLRIKLNLSIPLSVSNPESRDSKYVTKFDELKRNKMMQKFNPHNLSRNEVERFYKSVKYRSFDICNENDVSKMRTIESRIKSICKMEEFL